jgi:phage gp46-like protein
VPEYLIRANEGCAPDPFLLWDSVHIDIEGGTDFVCDWVLAQPGTNNLNVGGLQATSELSTAVYLALFTDAWVPPDHPLAYLADGDNRGWWGDGVDVDTSAGEGPLGSWLWLLERAPLVAAGVGVDQWAQSFALTALLPLQTQGAVAKIVTAAAVDMQNSRLELSVALYGSNGAIAYSGKFWLAWQQLAAGLPSPVVRPLRAITTGPTLDFSQPANVELFPAI